MFLSISRRPSAWFGVVAATVVLAAACAVSPPDAPEVPDSGEVSAGERIPLGVPPGGGDHGGHGVPSGPGQPAGEPSGPGQPAGEPSGSGGSGCGSGEVQACEESNSRGAVFAERFNASPSGPASVMNGLDGWFAQPIMQGPSGWGFAPEPMMAQHGENCEGPPSSHRIDTFEETVFACRDHVMTAINPPSSGTASAVVALKPDHMVDLSKGEAVIRVDVSTLSPSKGDWWEIWVTPWEDTLVAPADHWFHQAGPPRRGMFLQVNDHGNQKFWSHKFFDNYRFSGGLEHFWTAPDIRPIVSESDTRRDTYEIRMTRDRVRLLVESSETGEMVEVDEFAIPGGFPADQAVVQFQQSNYEPEKNGKFGCADPCPDVTQPATWHWDNVEISPAVPYTLIGVEEYMVWYGSPSKDLTFREPAPAAAEMLFTAQSKGNAPELSFDGGASWVRASAVRPPNDPPIAGFGGDPDLLTYRVAVPEGARSATIQGRGGCPTCNPAYSWAAFNFHIVSRTT